MTTTTRRFPRFRDLIGGLFSGKQVESIAESSETAQSTTGGGSDQRPVVIWTAAHSLEARIIKGRLESEGIPVALQGEAMSDILGLSSGSLARTDILVPAPLAEKAIKILEDEIPIDEDE